MKYYEEIFTIESEPDLKFRFKEMSPIDILSICNEIVNGVSDSEFYKKYLVSALENTEVQINSKWIPVKEGENYYPVYLKDDIRGLYEIVNKFFEKVIQPVFTKSAASTNPQQ